MFVFEKKHPSSPIPTENYCVNFHWYDIVITWTLNSCWFYNHTMINIKTEQSYTFHCSLKRPPRVKLAKQYYLHGPWITQERFHWPESFGELGKALLGELYVIYLFIELCYIILHDIVHTKQIEMVHSLIYIVTLFGHRLRKKGPNYMTIFALHWHRIGFEITIHLVHIYKEDGVLYICLNILHKLHYFILHLTKIWIHCHIMGHKIHHGVPTFIYKIGQHTSSPNLTIQISNIVVCLFKFGLVHILRNLGHLGHLGLNSL